MTSIEPGRADGSAIAPPETLELSTAVLSRFRESDAAELATAIAESLDHLRPWMPWAGPATATIGAQQRRARQLQHAWLDGSEYGYLLRGHAAGRVVGAFGLHRRIGEGGLEIGYWLHVDHTGRGHATAAARALTQAALDLPAVDRVEIHTDEANLASAAIPRRLGYELDRIEVRQPQAPSETGRLQIWVIGPHSSSASSSR